MIREFVTRLVERYDRKYWLARAEAGEPPTAMWKAVGDAGYLGVTVPEEYGGTP